MASLPVAIAAVASIWQLASAATPHAQVDLKGNAYASEPWDATFSVDLDGKPGPGPDHGTFTVRVHPDWAPIGAQRFQDLVAADVMKDARFFRVVPDFMVQFGIPADPKSAAFWEAKNLQDDPVKQKNTRGMLTYATAGENTRTTQMFINFQDNSENLDSQGFAPFAEVLGDGMDVVDKIQSKYGESPDQGLIQSGGNAYLAKDFPDLSFVSAISSKLYPGASVAAAGGTPKVFLAAAKDNL